MDYETIIHDQLSSMDLSELEELTRDAGAGSTFEDVTVAQIVDDLLKGRPIFDSDRILDDLMQLFIMEVKSSVLLGCEILTVCIVIGLLTNFSGSFGKSTVSSLGTVICSFVVIALCIGSFYQTYGYCCDAVNTM